GVVDQNRRDANGGIAAAMAMSSLPQAIKPGGMMVGVGMASWEGESGAAIGFSRRSQSDSVTVKAVVNFNSRGKAGVGVGVGFEF
ncbi:MAG: YadA-like family protein, partial [Zoogloeaceae bacterium]|nr:YadA-like family protein [Zoogloeaceae bacterium]